MKDGGDLVIMEPIKDSQLFHALRVMTGLCTAQTYTATQWIHTAQQAGFRMMTWFNFGYLAIPLLAYPECTHLMRYVPFRMPLARLLMHVDERLAQLPYVRHNSWKAVFHFQKPARVA